MLKFDVDLLLFIIQSVLIPLCSAEENIMYYRVSVTMNLFLFIDGAEYIGNVESIEACGKSCLVETRCVGVVYAPEVRNCWLKHAMVARTAANGRDSMVVVNRDRYLP